ncbi:MAG: ATP-grasp domain-containing protein [Bacteroidales bacterium]|nr:ATP-grasp domain-containing protein [Bacteroidales bacterium]
MKRKINIAVTGLNAIDNPGPGVAVIRALHEAKSFDVKIIGLAYESLEPGIYMHDIVDKTYQIPYPSAGTESLINRLEYIHSKENLNVIISNFDAELYSFMVLQSKLKEMGINTFLPTIKQFKEREKINLPEFGKKYGINVPKSKAIYNVNEIYELVHEFTYPVFVKGKFYEASIAHNEEQVKTHFNNISSKWGLPIIIQQFVQGTEFDVTGLGDGKGNTIAVVPMRKQYITDKGKAWGGISIDDEEILELTKNFIRSTKWRGAFEMDLMKSNNELYLLEINPRMPAWIYFSVGVGQNIPEALVRLAMGEKIEAFKKYSVGKMFIRYAYELIVDLKEFQQISTTGEL